MNICLILVTTFGPTYLFIYYKDYLLKSDRNLENNEWMFRLRRVKTYEGEKGVLGSFEEGFKGH